MWAKRLPWSIPAAAVPLVLVGWLAIARCGDFDSSSGHYLHKQIAWSVLGLIAMAAAALPSYRVLCRWSYLLFLASLGLLLAAPFFPLIHGTHRWIPLGPIGFQPSEFAKVAFVLALARYLMYRQTYRRLGGLLLPLVLGLVPLVLVLTEPDLGMAMLFLLVLFVMLFAAGARRRDLAILVAAGLLLTPLLWAGMSRQHKARIAALLDQPPADRQPRIEAAGHLHQAKRMFALGGPWGSLLAGQPTEDLAVYRLPEARNDFIFCVIKERLGLPGLALVVALYGVLAWRGLAIAAATREPFGRLVAVGLTATIALQALINMGMNLGLLPVTGLPLPLVSYGGSSLLASAVSLGLLVNVGMRPGYEVTNEPFRWVAE